LVITRAAFLHKTACLLLVASPSPVCVWPRWRFAPVLVPSLQAAQIRSVLHQYADFSSPSPLNLYPIYKPPHSPGATPPWMIRNAPPMSDYSVYFRTPTPHSRRTHPEYISLRRLLFSLFCGSLSARYSCREYERCFATSSLPLSLPTFSPLLMSSIPASSVCNPTIIIRTRLRIFLHSFSFSFFSRRVPAATSGGADLGGSIARLTLDETRCE